MIKEQYVDFDTAKLLKKKGFDEGCSFVFHKDSNGLLPCSWPTTNSEVSEENENMVTLPTQAMACRWLREVHKLDIIIFHERLGNDFYWARIETFPYVEHQQKKEYATWEESCEAAIKYCLEKLV